MWPRAAGCSSGNRRGAHALRHGLNPLPLTSEGIRKCSSVRPSFANHLSVGLEGLDEDVVHVEGGAGAADAVEADFQ